VVKLEPNYTESYDSWSGGYECDFECEYELLDREPLSPEEHAKRWQEFLINTKLDDELPRLTETPISGTTAVSLAWVCAPEKSER
jgi:hypothetical protein